MENSFKVIGLLIEDIFTDFARDIIEDAKKALNPYRNIRLVVIGGKFDDGMRTDDSINSYNAVYNTIFRLGSMCGLDGIIMHLGSLNKKDNRGVGTELLKSFGDIPTVLISSELDGFTTVGYDNKAGIREAIEWLVNVNGFTRLCMLGGRDDNLEACIRRQIFIDTLKEQGIMFREKMYEPTDMSENTEAEANRLLDNNPDTEAVFCVNDGSAVGLYKAMKKRGLVPGKDVLVFAFDNTRMASEMKPSLTSVGADNVTLGQRAVELLLSKINGGEVHSELIPTRLYGRSSFDYTMYEYNIKDLIDVNKQSIYRMFDDCFYRYGRLRRDRDAVDLRRLYYEFTSRMLVAMNNRYLSIEEFGEICRLIDIFFDEGVMEYTDTEKFLACIKRLQEGMAYVQHMRSVNVNVYINRLFLHMKDKALSVISEKNIRDKNKHLLNERDQRDFMVRTLTADRSGDGIRRIFGNIGSLGMKNAAVYMFDEPVRYERDRFALFPERISLVCTVKEGELYMLPKERSECELRDMLYRKELSSKCSGYLTFPVFFGEIIYGFMVCELDDDIYTRGEYIAMLIGRAIYIDRVV